MKLKFLLFVYLVFCIQLYSQQKLNVLMTVDDMITGSYNISKSYLLVNNDTIKMDYEMGRFILSEKDYKKLSYANKEEIVFLKFSYYTYCPEQKAYEYSLGVKLDLLQQSYFLVKIYNYENYPKVFKEEEGYGFEYHSPLNSSRLIKNRKMHRNPCVDLE